jgi:HEAT repeat protein
VRLFTSHTTASPTAHTAMRLAPWLLIGSLTLAPTALAGLNQTVSDLMPKLAAANVRERYAPEMELQRMVLNAARPGAEAERIALDKVLDSKVIDGALPQPARVWILRQLEYIGAANSVPALTALLHNSDAELRECARRALEKDSAPEAVESLRAALAAGGDTRWTIGLIQSLGQRRDAQSVDLIARKVDDPKTAFAACSALAKIASPAAVEHLWSALESGAPPAADALVAAADNLFKARQSDRAVAIYSKLCNSTSSIGVRSAALVGLASAAPDQAKGLIAEALSTTEPRLQVAAITAARKVYGAGASAALAPLFSQLNDSGQMAVLRVLEAPAEDQIIAAAGGNAEPLQLTAIARLGQVGTGKAVPVLLRLAAGERSPVQQAAVEALGRVHGLGADAAIAEMAAHGASGIRVPAIHALAQRSDTAAIPALLYYAGNSEPDVASASWAALGVLGGDTELAPVARRALETANPDAESALREIATRVQDKPAAAKQLVALLPDASPKQSSVVFETLAVLGGPTGLKTVSVAVSSGDEDVRQAAVRALANWPDFEAVKTLLEIASGSQQSPLARILAIQGVGRLVKSSDDVSVEARLEAALAAMKSATRADEKRLLLSAFASVRSPKAAEPIEACFNDPDVRNEAGMAGITLARSLYWRDRAAARKLLRAVAEAQISDQITRRAQAFLARRRR